MSRISMLIAGWLLLAFVPAMTFGQVSAQPQPDVIEELKAVRAVLERLERSNSVLLTLVRIQIDESRVATLEAQRQGLLSLELSLSEEVNRLAPAPKEAANSAGRLVQVGPGGEAVMSRDPNPARYNEATRKLEEVRRNLRNIEQSITSLRSRITAAEKRIEIAEPGR